MGGTYIYLSNTCTIDNGLTILHLSFKDHNTFRNALAIDNSELSRTCNRAGKGKKESGANFLCYTHYNKGYVLFSIEKYFLKTERKQCNRAGRWQEMEKRETNRCQIKVQKPRQSDKK